MQEFDELVEVIDKLRNECPWDKEQTHETLAKHLIEEAFRKKIKIISNDKFNEYLNDYNGKSWELKKNIFGYEILDGKIILLEK